MIKEKGGFEMKFYNVDIILENEQEERITKLAKRFKIINGWNEKDIMQFAVNAFPLYLNPLLSLMEIKAEQLEIEHNKEYNNK